MYEVCDGTQLPRGVADVLAIDPDSQKFVDVDIRTEPNCTFEPAGGRFSKAFFVHMDVLIAVAVAAFKQLRSQH